MQEEKVVYVLSVKSDAPVITVYGNRFDAEAEAKRLEHYSIETDIQEHPVIGKMEMCIAIGKMPEDEKMGIYKVEFYTRSDGFDYRIVEAKDKKEAIKKVKDDTWSNFCQLYGVEYRGEVEKD